MAITTTANRSFDVQVLEDTVQGTFAQKTAFMGSQLVTAGAVIVDGKMPAGDPSFIGNEITVPYFGTIGEFTSNPDGSSVTPGTLSLMKEAATISRDSLAFEVSHWARHSGPGDADPYEEAARQIMESATRAMDTRIITAAMTTPLVHDVYSSGTPVYLGYDVVADARAKWGDENRDVVGMICHSRVVTDLRKLKASDGRPLLVDGLTAFDVPRFCGLPIIESDRAPLTGSSMGTVSSSGTTPPVATLAGTPLGAFNLVIDCVLGGAHATATFRFSTDGGNTYSAAITTTSAAAAIPLIDTTTDSLVGVNGRTGLTVAFAAGTFNADNAWSSTAVLKARTLLLKRRALAFWYNRAALGLQTDKNILAHTDIAAMHLYAAAHCYRRTPGGTKPGVVAIAHNVGSYV
jgi:hypothetical protein